MFIREVLRKVKGKVYPQYQLVESIRTDRGPRQHLVLIINSLDLPENKWKTLANAIEAKLNKQDCFSYQEKDVKIQNLAAHYSETIIRKRLNEISEQVNKEDPDFTEYEQVDINSMKNGDARTIGAEQLILNQLKEYKIDKILKELKFSPAQINYAKMLIISRATHPSSERETVRWLKENSSTIELTSKDMNVYDNALHRTALKLLENKENIEENLAIEAKKVFKLEENIILHDLTNTYFESRKAGSKIAKYGKSKDKRNDQPLVSIALTVDEDGFAKKSRILEGNIAEAKTLEKTLNQIKDSRLSLKNKTIVMDAGMASEENINLIKEKGFNYIVVSRKRKYEKDFFKEKHVKHVELSDKKTKVKIQISKTEEETYLLCYSEQKAKRDKDILDTKIKKFESQLDLINKKLKEARTIKKYENIIEKIGRLKQIYGIGNLYKINVKQKGNKAIKIEYKRNEKAEEKIKKQGYYVIRTSRQDLTEKEIFKIYRSLTTVEDSFRSMKTELGLRPNYHKADKPTIAHIFITILAYHIISGILKKLKKSGINYKWETVRNILSTYLRITTSFKTESTRVITVRDNIEPNASQKEIFDRLEIKHNFLKKEKIKT